MILFLCVGLPLLLTILSSLILVKTITKGNGQYFEFAWRFTKWAQRPVYVVEYFGLPWQYLSHKEGKFLEEHYTNYSYRAVKEELKWRRAEYAPTAIKDFYGIKELKGCWEIRAHSEGKARWEFRHSPMFKQNPYLEYRIVETTHGLLKSVKKRQADEKQREMVSNYRQSYIKFLEKELNNMRELH